jgi:hypothetical protein
MVHFMRRLRSMGTVLALPLLALLFCLESRTDAKNAQCPPPCDCEVLPVDSALGYALRGRRCEGQYRQEVANDQTGLQLASFTIGDQEFKADVVDTIPVRWQATDGTVHLRAQPTVPELYYRMDADVAGPLGAFDWPTGVLRASQITRSRIGTTAWTVEGGTRIYLPVVVASNGAAPDKSTYRIVVVPAYPATELTVTLTDLAGKTIEKLGQSGYYPSAQGVYFVAKAVPGPRMLKLRLEAQWRTGGLKVSELSFRTP